MKNLLLYVVCVLFANALYAQATGKLVGKITDEATDDIVLLAPLRLLKGGEQIASAESDFDGYYEFPNIPAGVYELVCTPPDLPTIEVSNVKIYSGRTREYDIRFPRTEDLKTPIYIDMERPIVPVDNNTNAKMLEGDIFYNPSQRDAGEATNGEGKRVESVEYFGSVRVFGRKLSRKELRKIRRTQKKEAKKK